MYRNMLHHLGNKIIRLPSTLPSATPCNSVIILNLCFEVDLEEIVEHVYRWKNTHQCTFLDYPLSFDKVSKSSVFGRERVKSV